MIHWNDISMRLVGLCLSWSSCIWQIYTSETLKQAEGVVSTVRCEGREHALGRGIKRKLDSIHSMHSTLHEDQDGQYCMVLLDVKSYMSSFKYSACSSKSILRRNCFTIIKQTPKKRHGFIYIINMLRIKCVRKILNNIIFDIFWQKTSRHINYFIFHTLIEKISSSDES